MTDIRQAYIDWLEAKIHEHQTEVARLSVALEVFLEMPTKRLQGAVERAKPKKQTIGRAATRQVEQHILDLLKESPGAGLKPIEILNRLGISSDKSARRPWYNALSRLEKQGALVRRVLVAGQSAVYELPVSPIMAKHA